MFNLANFLPSSLVSDLIVLGLLFGSVLYIVGNILPVSLIQYKFPAKIIGVLLVLCSVYFTGVQRTNQEWEVKQKDREIEIAKLLDKSKTSSNKIEIKYVDRIKTVDRVKVQYEEIIKETITQREDARCDIPNGFVRVYNESIDGKVPGTSSKSDEGTSEIKLSEVTKTVVENNLTTEQIREQLILLQEWIKVQQSIFNND